MVGRVLVAGSLYLLLVRFNAVHLGADLLQDPPLVLLLLDHSLLPQFLDQLGAFETKQNDGYTNPNKKHVR